MNGASDLSLVQLCVPSTKSGTETAWSGEEWRGVERETLASKRANVDEWMDLIKWDYLTTTGGKGMNDSASVIACRLERCPRTEGEACTSNIKYRNNSSFFRCGLQRTKRKHHVFISRLWCFCVCVVSPRQQSKTSKFAKFASSLLSRPPSAATTHLKSLLSRATSLLFCSILITVQYIFRIPSCHHQTDSPSNAQ